MNTRFDDEYNRLCNNVINNGTMIKNERTGKNCLTYFGDTAKYDLSDGLFPLLTTKKVAVKPMIAEKLGFIRAYDSAADFRKLGCNIWDANANSSKHWLDNPWRKGVDDLGSIYGVQARKWVGREVDGEIFFVDQLKSVVDKISKNIDDRRLIVNHWNPGELHRMSLPPCHMQYIFGIRGDYLDVCMTQRSCDLPLGIPFNIASYALLLILIAKITGKRPGIFTHFMWNLHIYEDQLELLKEQMTRTPHENTATITINDKIKSLDDLETWVTVDDFVINNYTSHPAIKFPFAE